MNNQLCSFIALQNLRQKERTGCNGIHRTGILVGTIVSSQVDDSILTDGKVDLDKMQPIMFDMSTNTYRVIGPVVGRAFHDGLKLK